MVAKKSAHLKWIDFSDLEIMVQNIWIFMNSLSGFYQLKIWKKNNLAWFWIITTLQIGVYTQKGRGHFGLIWQ